MMPSFIIQPGQKFEYLGKVVSFRRRAKDRDRTHVFEDADGIPIALSAEEIIQARAENRMRDWVQPSFATTGLGKREARAPFSLATANDHEKFEAERQEEYVREWLKDRTVPRSNEALEKLCEVVHARRVERRMGQNPTEPPRISGSWLKRLIRKWLHGGEKRDALIPRTRLRGNYRDRLSRTITDIMWEQTEEHYLRLNGVKVARLHYLIEEAIKEQNKKLPPGKRLPIPGPEAVTRFVRKLCAHMVTFCRKGEAAAKLEFRLVDRGWLTKHANQIWEIDDTRADLICLHNDRKTVIGRPWLTYVIDRHTRMIMSFVLTFSPPDTETALEAVRLAMLPKDDFPVAAPAMGQRWPAQGRPTEIHVDNGSAYNSKAFIMAIESMGIIHQTMPLLKAWFKAVVERLIGTTMQQVFHTVAGTTYSNFYDRESGDIAPEKVAEATLEDAQGLLLTWLLEEYLVRVHRGIGEPVINAWSRSMGEHEQRLPLSREDIEVATSSLFSGTIQKGGIVVDGLLYLSAHALDLEMEAKKKSDREVVVRRNPGDLTTISFLDARVTDKSKEQWFTATISAVDRIKIEGITLEEYRLARALRRQRPEEYGDNDPHHVETNRKVKEQLEIGSGSERLSARVAAEGHKEAIQKQTRHRIRRMQAIAIGGTGEDLQAELEGALAPDVPAGEIAPVAFDDDDEAEMRRIQSAHNVGVRGPGKEK